MTSHDLPQAINALRIAPDAILPTRAHPEDAGMDLYCYEDTEIEPGHGKLVRSGVALAIPAGNVGMVADRSSMAKRGVKTAGGIIDAGYRGEIHVVLWNISRESIRIARGERMAQMLIIPIATPKIVEAVSLDETQRGNKGFGSTGK